MWRYICQSSSSPVSMVMLRLMAGMAMGRGKWVGGDDGSASGSKIRDATDGANDYLRQDV